MSFKIDPKMMESTFAVPTAIVDRHIRLANEHQLKVLLWTLRRYPEEADFNKMCSDLKMNPDDANDYLQYWILTGVINENGFTAPTDNQPVKSAPAPEPAPVAAIQPFSAPSSAEISVRIEEAPEIGHLFKEAQAKIGRTIGYSGQCTLLMMHDHYGMPVEVIFMIIDYCVSVGKFSYGYIGKMAQDWFTKDIDTLEKAAEVISRLRNTNTAWKDFSIMAGLSNTAPSTKQAEFMSRWSNEWKFSTDMIYLAYEQMVDHTTKFSLNYMNKVLQNWHENSITTPEAVEAANELHAAKTQVNNTKTKKTAQTAKPQKTVEASYDLDEFKKESLLGDLTYERKEKK